MSRGKFAIGIKHEHGFTLIEIMVALLILAGLSILMAQSVRSGLESRTKIQLQIQEESAIREAMKLLASEVAAAFHHRDFTVSVYNKVLELRKKQAQDKAQAGVQPADPSQAPPPATGSTAGVPSNPPVQPDPLALATPMPTPIQMTGFVGNATSMTFTVRNHVRRYFNAPESDQSRISYFVRSCQSGGRGESKGRYLSTCLVRKETTMLDNNFPLSPADDSDDEAPSIVLLPNVQSFKLRYIAAGMQDYTDTWDSTKGSGSIMPNATAGAGGAPQDGEKFPDAVEITLSTQDKENPKSKLKALTWLAPIRFSNNFDESDKEATPTPDPTKQKSPQGSQK